MSKAWTSGKNEQNLRTVAKKKEEGRREKNAQQSTHEHGKCVYVFLLYAKNWISPGFYVYFKSEQTGQSIDTLTQYDSEYTK